MDIIRLSIRLTTGTWGFFLPSHPLVCRTTLSNSREPIMELGLKLMWFWFVEISLMAWSDGTRWCWAHSVTKISITGLLQVHRHKSFKIWPDGHFRAKFVENVQHHSYFPPLAHLACTVVVVSCPPGSSTVRVMSLSMRSSWGSIDVCYR